MVKQWTLFFNPRHHPLGRKTIGKTSANSTLNWLKNITACESCCFCYIVMHSNCWQVLPDELKDIVCFYLGFSFKILFLKCHHDPWDAHRKLVTWATVISIIMLNTPQAKPDMGYLSTYFRNNKTHLQLSTNTQVMNETLLRNTPEKMVLNMHWD